LRPAEDYILEKPEPFKSILTHLQMLIENGLTDATLEYKWGLPCYYIDKRPICYLNQSKDYVDVGFWHSVHLSKKWDQYLVTENRKVIKSLRYKTLEDIDNDILLKILKEVETHKNSSF